MVDVLRSALRGGAFVAGTAVTGVLVAGKVVGRQALRATDEIDELLVRLDRSDTAGVTHHHVDTADGGSLHCVEVGSGRPVVLLHGVTLQWWIWSPVMQLLSDRYRVISWDMRGHGQSVPGSAGITWDACADDLALLLDHLDLQDAILVGHSMGGMVMTHFLGRHAGLQGTRVGALGFLATSAATRQVRGWKGGASAIAGLLPPFARTMARFPAADLQQHSRDLSAAFMRLAFGERATARMVGDLMELNVALDPESLVQSSVAIANHDARSNLAHTQVPTAVMVGTQDRLTPVAHSKALMAGLPAAAAAELVVFPGIGHQVMQEDPKGLVAAIEALAART